MHLEFCAGKETLRMNSAWPYPSLSAFWPHSPGTWQRKPAEAQHTVMSTRASEVHLIPASLGTGAQAPGDCHLALSLEPAQLKRGGGTVLPVMPPSSPAP